MPSPAAASVDVACCLNESPWPGLLSKKELCTRSPIRAIRSCVCVCVCVCACLLFWVALDSVNFIGFGVFRSDLHLGAGGLPLVHLLGWSPMEARQM